MSKERSKAAGILTEVHARLVEKFGLRGGLVVQIVDALLKNT